VTALSGHLFASVCGSGREPGLSLRNSHAAQRNEGAQIQPHFALSSSILKHTMLFALPLVFPAALPLSLSYLAAERSLISLSVLHLGFLVHGSTGTL